MPKNTGTSLYLKNQGEELCLKIQAQDTTSKST